MSWCNAAGPHSDCSRAKWSPVPGEGGDQPRNNLQCQSEHTHVHMGAKQITSMLLFLNPAKIQAIRV